MRRSVLVLFCGLVVLSVPHAAVAQAAPPADPPAGPWTQTASAGLAWTNGNKDTSTVNLGYDMVYDPKASNLVKFSGLFYRGRTDGELTSDRLALDGRDEYRLHDHLFTFGQLQYLRDQFKDIDYLVAPSIGVGYRLADSPETQLSVDGGFGAVWEKSPTGEVESSGAVTVAQKLSHRISETTTLTQSVAALYKTPDFSDALYTFGSAVSASMTEHTQLKVELIDTYKTRVPEGFGQNDVAVLVGMVFKR